MFFNRTRRHYSNIDAIPDEAIFVPMTIGAVKGQNDPEYEDFVGLVVYADDLEEAVKKAKAMIRGPKWRGTSRLPR